MNRVIDLIGPFHPVLVHLPIGFLLLAIIFQWLAVKEKYASLQTAIRVSWLLGAISAILSCLTGLALSSGDEYEASTLQFHQWFGIGVAVLSLAACFFSSRPFSRWQRILSVIVFVLILITGHLGGTLTHGEGFLTKGLSGEMDNRQPAQANISDVQEAVVFADVVQPVFIDKCGSCHSAVKQKGGLRLDAADWIIKGGKNGPVYIDGDATGSELYKRIVLDPVEKKHMPPKGKPQLTETEINLLHWWITSHAGFSKKVKEVSQPANIVVALEALKQAPSSLLSSVPQEEVDAAPGNAIAILRKEAVSVSQVAMNSNYLQVSFVAVPKPGKHLMDALSALRKQLVWLKMPGAQLTADDWKEIADYKALTRLSLEHSTINDAGIAQLVTLEHLQYLNLVGTNVSAQGIQQLKNIKTLNSIYLAQTKLTPEEFAAIQKMMPRVDLDSGNYRVPTLATDTQVLKPPVKK
jgi:uncharacterized membrane protein/mono/diheme cytochrome c family protein